MMVERFDVFALSMDTARSDRSESLVGQGYPRPALPLYVYDQ